MTGPDERDFFDQLQGGADEAEPADGPPVPPVEQAPGSPPSGPAQVPYAGHSAPPPPSARWMPANAPLADRPAESRDQPPATPSSPASGADTDPRHRAADDEGFTEPTATPRREPDTELLPRVERSWGPSAEEGSSAGASSWELMRDQLRASNLTPVRKIPPSRGWRKWLYGTSFRRINPGESPDERRLRFLNETVDTPLRGTYSVVVLGGKGGAGKTTTAAAIGSTLALLRNDKVVAIDADPAQAANLASRIDPRATSSFGEVIADQQLSRYSDMRSHVGQNPAGLDVLASASQPGRGPVDAAGYSEAHRRLERFYSLLIADSGVDLQHPVTAGVLGCADAVVLVASAVPDGAEGAARVMDWLSEMGYRQLASRMVVVVNHIRPFSSRRDKKQSRQLVDTLLERFGDWVGRDKVFVVPYDPHIANAGVLDLDQLRPQTRRRFLEITAMLASGFAATTEGRR
jgi:MinD-like ATPase involved in chromosome partitioning or flagellar assembly